MNHQREHSLGFKVSRRTKTGTFRLSLPGILGLSTVKGKIASGADRHTREQEIRHQTTITTQQWDMQRCLSEVRRRWIFDEIDPKTLHRCLFNALQRGAALYSMRSGMQRN